MYLTERKPTLSDFFGIAVKTTSRQASGLSVYQPPQRTRIRRYSHRRVDQLRARTISRTTPSDPGCLPILALAKALRNRGTSQPAVASLPQSHVVPDAEVEPNVAFVHCGCHHDKPRDHVHLQQQPTHVCEKRASGNCISDVCFPRSK